MKMFESHTHYDDSRFDNDRDELLEVLQETVEFAVNAGADIETSRKSILLSKMYKFIYASVGVHPHDVQNLNEDDMKMLKKMANDNEKVVAIGEIGLDYYYDNSDRDKQREWFERQIEVAKDVKLPIIVHSRDATKDTLDIIKKTNAKSVGGVIHCFSGSVETALEYVKMGFYIGISGVVTYKNAQKTVDVVKEVPMEYLLIETDSPYLSPVPNRGKRNDSRNLKYVAEKIAEIKGVNIAEVIENTKENAKRMYGIK